ncbi:MAG: helix-turn-helix domain-containing protein [Paludibacteraceae bacterium]|nr:helix-turn-helix domain-containing protein [Paludibacteraceae bacterium]
MQKKDILSKLVDYYAEGNKSRFASFLDVTPQTVSTWFSRNTFDIDRIYAKCDNISGDWLLTGEGPMLKADSDGEVKESKAEPSADGLPLVPIEAVAGFNGDDMPGVRLEDCLRYVVPEFAAAGAEYLIRVSGSSMYPKYSSGDILACRRIPEIDFFQWGKIYVIDSSQGAMVKRIYQCEDDAACVLCKSDNDKYPPFTLPKSAIRSLSIVIGVIRLE